jgi:hypothetical protein
MVLFKKLAAFLQNNYYKHRYKNNPPLRGGLFLPKFYLLVIYSILKIISCLELNITKSTLCCYALIIYKNLNFTENKATEICNQFLHFKNIKMFTKKSIYILICLISIISTGNTQSVFFKFTDGTTASYVISDLQNFTYSGNTMIVKRKNGTTVTYNRSSIAKYRYDATTSVRDYNVINSAEVRIYPNPFRGSVRIRYELLAAEQVSVEILDMSGRSIKKWPTAKRTPGSYEVIWQPGDANGQAVPSGTYICRIQTSKGTVSKMMVME